MFVPFRGYYFSFIRFLLKFVPVKVQYVRYEQNELSQTIRDLRKEYHLTQEDLAFRSGVGYRFIRELEAGKPTVRMDKVNQVLALFDRKLGVVQIERSEV